MEFKTLALIGGNLSLDNHSNEEIIRLDWQTTGEGFFYFKQKYLYPNVIGAQSEYEDKCRVRSLWYANLKSSQVSEVVPHGKFDIEDFRASSNDYYYILKNDYSLGKQICRIDMKTKKMEICIQVDEDFHGFELVTDRYIMYRSEDKIPDVSELVIIDLEQQKITGIANTRNDTDQFEYLFVLDTVGEIQQLILNRWVPEHGKFTSKNNLISCNWNEIEPLLMWESI